MNTKDHLIWAIAVILIVGFIVGGGVSTCAYMNKRYYDVQANCIEKDGTYVPSGQGGWSGTCIHR